MLEKREFEKNDFMWRVSYMTTLVAGSFSLLVFVMLIISYLQIRSVDPVWDETITQMRIDYAEVPEEDAALAKRIQDMDLMTRKLIFMSQYQLRVGGIMLLIGISVFMIAFKNMTRWRPDKPELADVPTAEKEFLALAESRNLITWGAVIMLVGGLAASFMTESALVGAAVPDSAGEEPTIEAVVAKVFPDWDAMQQQWPSFRGPGSLGEATFTNAPTDWDVESGKNIKWKVELSRDGLNSPVIWGNRLFLSGADAETREVYCYDTETGELLWTREVTGIVGSPAESPQVSGDTGHDAATMVVHGDQVFAIFANADLVSFDFEGNQVWGKNLGVIENHYGYSSSLVAYGDKLFVQVDQMENGKVIALEVETGKAVWSTAREEISWASPVIAPTPFGPQLIVVSTEDVDAYDLDTGKLLWSQEVMGGEVAPSAAYHDGLVFAANEFAMASAIRIGETDGVASSEIAWQYDELLPEVSSPVGDGERFYFATSVGDIVCLDAVSGEELWAAELDDGFYSSMVLVDDRIYVSDMPGNMYIIKAGPEYELIRKIDMGEGIFATPAFLDGRIYLRTKGHLYCIEEQNV